MNNAYYLPNFHDCKLLTYKHEKWHVIELSSTGTKAIKVGEDIWLKTEMKSTDHFPEALQVQYVGSVVPFVRLREDIASMNRNNLVMKVCLFLTETEFRKFKKTMLNPYEVPEV